MKQSTNLSKRGDSGLIYTLIATVCVGIVMAIYYSIFIGFTKIVTPSLAAIFATSILALFLGYLGRRQLKYGSILLKKYLPDDDITETDQQKTETEKLIERTRRLEQDDTEETIDPSENSETPAEEEFSKEVPREEIMKLLKEEDYTGEDVKANLSK